MNNSPNFDGCSRPCRTGGTHTDIWGECAFAVEPEPFITIGGKAYVASDGELSVGFQTMTLSQLAERAEQAIRSIPIQLGPNSLTILEHGGTVGLSAGEYSAMALAVAMDLIENPSPVSDYRDMVNAPLSPETITALGERLRSGDHPTRRVSRHAAMPSSKPEEPQT
jgi:hypothetical protein